MIYGPEKFLKLIASAGKKTETVVISEIEPQLYESSIDFTLDASRIHGLETGSKSYGIGRKTNMIHISSLSMNKFLFDSIIDSTISSSNPKISNVQTLATLPLHSRPY